MEETIYKVKRFGKWMTIEDAAKYYNKPFMPIKKTIIERFLLWLV